MKILIFLLYIVSLFLLFTGIMGGTLTEPFVMKNSEKVIAEMGIDKTRIDSLDSQIDFAFNTVKTVLKKLENVKDVITFKEADLQPVQFTRNYYIREIVYEPVVSGVSFAIRAVMIITGLFLLAMTALIHTVKSYMDLRKRIRVLENKVSGLGPGIQSK